MTTILVAGAINTDFVATMQRAPSAGETITADGFAIFAGGKGANQAVSASRNEVSVAMLGAVGNDDIGVARFGDLQHVGIDTTWVVTDDAASSGVALIFVESSGENRIAYVPGATSNLSADHARDAFAHIAPEIVLAPNELGADVLADLFESCRTSGTPVVYNVAPFSVDARLLVRFADVVVLNSTEFHDLTGEELGDLADASRALKSLGVVRAVITRGAEGAVVIADGEAASIAAPAVTVVDSTGAGDALCGALAAALGRGESLDDAAMIGVYAGSLACTVAGAQPSSPTLEAIRAAMVTR